MYVKILRGEQATHLIRRVAEEGGRREETIESRGRFPRRAAPGLRAPKGHRGALQEGECATG